MSMQNKFNIGDRLWPIMGPNATWSVHMPFDVQYIWADGNEIMYGFNTSYGFPEINVFASEAEAKEECDRRKH